MSKRGNKWKSSQEDKIFWLTVGGLAISFISVLANTLAVFLRWSPVELTAVQALIAAAGACGTGILNAAMKRVTHEADEAIEEARLEDPNKPAYNAHIRVPSPPTDETQPGWKVRGE